MPAFKSKALSIKIGGQTTPQTKLKPVVAKAGATMPPLKSPTVGSNAQATAMQQALNKTRQVQKVYGAPGIN